MEIKNVAAYPHRVSQVQEKTPGIPSEDRAVLEKDVSSFPDRLELSKGYKEMAQVKKVMMERGDVRMEKVEHLRNMIENNTYEVDPAKVAQKMLEELW